MNKLSDGIKTATETAKDSIATAKAKTAETSAAARGVTASKDLAHKAIDRTGDSIDKNPLAIVLGGLALGVIAGALIPRSEREGKMLGKTGKKLNKKAKKMAEAAKAAGQSKVDSLGLNGDALRDQFRGLVSKAAEAVRAAGEAAAEKKKKKD